MKSKLEQLQEISPRTAISITSTLLCTAYSLSKLVQGDYDDFIVLGLAAGVLAYESGEYLRVQERVNQARNFLFPPQPKRREPAARRDVTPDQEPSSSKPSM